MLVAVTVGLLAAAWTTYTSLMRPPQGAARGDWDHLWMAARLLWTGVDPYVAIGPEPGARYAFDFPLFYPLSTVVAVLPSAWLPVSVARAGFVATSFMLLSWHMTRRAWWPLWWLFGFPAIQAGAIAQWSPLLLGAALSRGRLGQALLVLKPQDAAVWLLTAPTRRRMVAILTAGALLGAAAWAFQPWWPVDWLRALRRARHIVPFAQSPLSWPVLATALVLWRVPEARLLGALCVVPITHTMYAMLPVGVAARSARQMILLVALALLGEGLRLGYAPRLPYEEMVMAIFTWPATALVWWNERRPSDGARNSTEPPVA